MCGSSDVFILQTAGLFKSLVFHNSTDRPLLLLWQLISVLASIPPYLWMLFSQEGWYSLFCQLTIYVHAILHLMLTYPEDLIQCYAIN